MPKVIELSEKLTKILEDDLSVEGDLYTLRTYIIDARERARRAHIDETTAKVIENDYVEARKKQ